MAESEEEESARLMNVLDEVHREVGETALHAAGRILDEVAKTIENVISRVNAETPPESPADERFVYGMWDVLKVITRYAEVVRNWPERQ